MSKPRSKWRIGGVVVRLALVLAFIVPFCMINVQPAAAGIPKCTFLPDPVSRSICKHLPGGGGDIPGTGGINLPKVPGITSIPGIPSPSSIIKNDIVGPVLDQVSQYEANAVGNSLNNSYQYVKSGTTPALGQKWFLDEYAILFGMALIVGMALLSGRLGMAVKNTDPGEAVGAFSAWLVLIVGGGVIPALVGGILKVVDGPITQGWMDGPGNSVKSALKTAVTNLDKSHNWGSAVLLPLVFLFFGLIGGVLTEFEVFFREGALYVFTAAEVLALALLVGGRFTISGFYRITYGLLGLIMLRLMIAILLTTGLHLLNAQGQGADPIILGATMAILTPAISWAAYKAISKHNIQPGAVAADAVAKVRLLLTLAG